MALALASFIMFLALALRLKSLALALASDYVSLTPTLLRFNARSKASLV